MLDQPTLKDTVLEKRINDTANSKPKSSYPLKSDVMLNRNIQMYTEEQKEYIKTELKDFIQYFGYVDNPNDPQNLTPFFKYEDHCEEDFQNYNGFKKHNQNVLSKLGQAKEAKTLRIGVNG